MTVFGTATWFYYMEWYLNLHYQTKMNPSYLTSCDRDNMASIVQTPFFFNENCCSLMWISFICVTKEPIDHKLAWAQTDMQIRTTLTLPREMAVIANIISLNSKDDAKCFILCTKGDFAKRNFIVVRSLCLFREIFGKWAPYIRSALYC